jgi:hypothetical protein
MSKLVQNRQVDDSGGSVGSSQFLVLSSTYLVTRVQQIQYCKMLPTPCKLASQYITKIDCCVEKVGL